ncbi:hypothetical protein IM876_15860 [Serratia plymuthica]|uniref:hypothetical protein n=1 Tax=Serratia plymuthica TaxID=82996 RepID=UPI0019293219|nr:hypothetical protein [Serratia plymuthica]MBL3524154.1 hypothetical protein [Serratia plymuthica]
MSDDEYAKSLSYLRALADVVGLTLLANDEQRQAEFKQQLKLILNHPQVSLSPEAQELFAHFASLLDRSGSGELLSIRAPLTESDQPPRRDRPHLRLLTGGKADD